MEQKLGEYLITQGPVLDKQRSRLNKIEEYLEETLKMRTGDRKMKQKRMTREKNQTPPTKGTPTVSKMSKKADTENRISKQLDKTELQLHEIDQEMIMLNRDVHYCFEDVFNTFNTLPDHSAAADQNNTALSGFIDSLLEKSDVLQARKAALTKQLQIHLDALSIPIDESADDIRFFENEQIDHETEEMYNQLESESAEVDFFIEQNSKRRQKLLLKQEEVQNSAIIANLNLKHQKTVQTTEKEIETIKNEMESYVSSSKSMLGKKSDQIKRLSQELEEIRSLQIYLHDLVSQQEGLHLHIQQISTTKHRISKTSTSPANKTTGQGSKIIALLKQRLETKRSQIDDFSRVLLSKRSKINDLSLEITHMEQDLSKSEKNVKNMEQEIRVLEDKLDAMHSAIRVSELEFDSTVSAQSSMLLENKASQLKSSLSDVISSSTVF